MKIERETKTKTFVPVIIRLESEEEHDMFRELFARPIDESLELYMKRKEFSMDKRDRIIAFDSNLDRAINVCD